MKNPFNKGALVASLCLVTANVWADGHEVVKFNVPDVPRAEFLKMHNDSFKTKGIAKKEWLEQADFNEICSSDKTPSKATLKKIEADQMKTIKYPADGNYFGDWKKGEKIAQSGRALTWSDPSLTKPRGRKENGGGCYNCHQLSHKELSYGTIGTSLRDYGKIRGKSDEIVKYTWGKIYNAKATNACSNMPRNGDADILTEEQIKHLMALLFDPESPVNKK